MLTIRVYSINIEKYANIFESNYLNLFKKLTFLDETAIESILYLFTNLCNLDFINLNNIQSNEIFLNKIAFSINISLKENPQQYVNYVVFKK